MLLFAEYFDAPDTYNNIEDAILSRYRPEITQLSRDSTVLMVSNESGATAVKILPKEYVGKTPTRAALLGEAKANEAQAVPWASLP